MLSTGGLLCVGYMMLQSAGFTSGPLVRPNTAYSADLSEHSCGFRRYREPLHHEGLPYLSEVFATNDSVYVISRNGGICDREWRGAHDFWGHTFVWEFPDGTRVTSDPIPPTRHDAWADSMILIRYDLPVHYHSFVVQQPNEAKTTTQLVVHLHATIDLELDAVYTSSSAKLGVYRDLPVCPRKWPQNQTTLHNRYDTSVPPQKKYLLSMSTQIRMVYETFEVDNRYSVRIDSRDIISWIEYNLMIGFEHFYIFDNDPIQHGDLEQLLQAFVEEGLVDHVWYPMPDCYIDSDDKMKGDRLTISQATSSTTSLCRYEHETTCMGHFDIDEYIQVPEQVKDLKQVLQTIPSNIVSVTVQQKWAHKCENSNGTMDRSLDGLFSPLTHVVCVNDDTTPPKAIMRTSDVLGSFVHGPWVKMNHDLFNWDADSMIVPGLDIAHVRGSRSRDSGKDDRPIGQQYIIRSLKYRLWLQERIEARMAKLLGA